MKRFFLTATLLIYYVAFSQSHNKGFSFGINSSEVERPNYDYYKSKLGLGVEGYYEYRKKVLSLKSSLGYQQKGFTQDLIFVDTAGNVLGKGAPEWHTFNYLNLSQTIGLHFGSKIFGFCNVGIGSGYYLFTKVDTEDFTLDNGQVSQGYSYRFSNIKKFDLWLSGEFGFGFRTKHNTEFYLLTGYNRGIMKNGYSKVATPDLWKNHNWVFRFGYTSELNWKRNS